MSFKDALAVRPFYAYFCTKIVSTSVKYNVSKEICEQLNLQRQPLVQDEGDSVIVNLYPSPFRMVKVEGGTFLMGAQDKDPDGENYHPLADEDASPVHQVTLDSYYIGETVVTQGLWRTVMGNDDHRFVMGQDDFPAVRINWNECQYFVQRLNQMTKLKFRLPTEAEWEFAARGGNKSRGYVYSGSNELNKVAWSEQSHDKRLHSVKQKRHNELGLYDMSGNVWEWCSDWDGNYPTKEQHNPKGPKSDKFYYHVIRGGSWNDPSWFCYVFQRFANRYDKTWNDCGLRLAMTGEMFCKPIKHLNQLQNSIR